MRIKKALTIAGSDSGGGAGIQADLKTFAALGVYGSCVITAITAQNTRGVQASGGVEASLVEKQLDSVLQDIGADAMKTGMLYSAGIIEAVASRLEAYHVPWLVVDPVMVSTSGDRLLNESAVGTLRDILLPMAGAVTPNVDEAEVLCGFPIETDRNLQQAAREMHLMGPELVIITGVRQEDRCIDICFDGNDYIFLSEPYIDTPHTHGTGCSFSAALTAFLARGLAPLAASAQAKKYVSGGLRCAYQVGNGRSPINHMAGFFPGRLNDPDILEIRSGAFRDWGKPFRLLPLPLPLLNVIIGGPLCQERDYVELTRLAVENGASLIQLREKEGECRQLVEIASRMGRVCHEHGALFIVNDRVDIAAACGADGVHIGQEDLPLPIVRALLGPEKIIGVSAADLDEAVDAIEGGADYLGVGPVYPTVSKNCRTDACGTNLVAELTARSPVPIIAIGGVTPHNTQPLLKAGAAGVAVISAVLGSNDPAAAVRDFITLLREPLT